MELHVRIAMLYVHCRDVTTGTTGATTVTPKFSDTLTLFQPREAGSAHHWHSLRGYDPEPYIIM